MDLIGKPQGQRQGGQEGLPAGERAYTAPAAVVVVQDFQLQAALAAVAVGDFLPPQLVLSPGHDHEAGVGPMKDALKAGDLHIGLQGQLLLAGEGPVDGVG